MKLNKTKKLMTVFLVLMFSGVVLACMPAGGGCGDKETTDAVVINADTEAQHLAGCGRRGGCGSDTDTKDCPKK